MTKNIETPFAALEVPTIEQAFIKAREDFYKRLHATLNPRRPGPNTLNEFVQMLDRELGLDH